MKNANIDTSKKKLVPVEPGVYMVKIADGSIQPMWIAEGTLEWVEDEE